jgi:hypothetical protein
MLVCNISLRAPRSAIAAELVEVAAALDASITGSVFFATLVDDPASVGDTVDAYLGEIMVEAASAADSITAGSAYSTANDEAATATDLQDATMGVAVVARDAMVMDVFINHGLSRQAHVDGVMINQ